MDLQSYVIVQIYMKAPAHKIVTFSSRNRVGFLLFKFEPLELHDAFELSLSYQRPQSLVTSMAWFLLKPLRC